MQVAARSGGIFFPLAKALCLACGSDSSNGTQSKMGGQPCSWPGHLLHILLTVCSVVSGI